MCTLQPNQLQVCVNWVEPWHTVPHFFRLSPLHSNSKEDLQQIKEQKRHKAHKGLPADTHTTHLYLPYPTSLSLSWGRGYTLDACLLACLLVVYIQ